jgi:hypothetical protein
VLLLRISVRTFSDSWEATAAGTVLHDRATRALSQQRSVTGGLLIVGGRDVFEPFLLFDLVSHQPHEGILPPLQPAQRLRSVDESPRKWLHETVGGVTITHIQSGELEILEPTAQKVIKLIVGYTILHAHR